MRLREVSLCPLSSCSTAPIPSSCESRNLTTFLKREGVYRDRSSVHFTLVAEKKMDVWCLLICFWLSLPGSIPGTEALPPTVNGVRGHSVSLSPEIAGGLDIGKIEWRKTSLRSKITEFSKGNIAYFGTEEYGQRITLHPKSLTLEIRDLRREDAGDYEVTVILRSGTEIQSRIRLEVYEPVSGTHIVVQNITGICTLTCSVTSGDTTSFRWWREGEPLGNDSTHHLWGHGETVEVHHAADFGDVVYRCEARNPGSEGTAEIRLKDVCKQTISGESSCLCGCRLRAIIAAVLLLCLLSFMIAIHIISSHPVTGTRGRLHKAE
ncbi:SLAM family member 5-like [Rhinoraja longicauda]